MFDLFSEIMQTLRNNKLRTALTGLAVAWGIFLLITLLGVSRGTYNSFAEQMDVDNMSWVQMWGGYTSRPYKGFKEGRRIVLRYSDIDQLRHEIGHEADGFGATLSVDSSRVSSQRDYIDEDVDGVYPGFKESEGIKMVAGRFINQRDLDTNAKVIVLGNDAVNILFDCTAEEAIGQRVKLAGLSWLVVGVYNSRWRRTSYVPLTTVMMLQGWRDEASQIDVNVPGLESHDDFDQLAERLRQSMSSLHEFDPNDNSALYVWGQIEAYLQANTGLGMLQTVMWVIGLLTMLSGIVGVSNIMFVSVRERTHEIGIRRAIGAKPRSIMLQIVTESVAITTLSGYIGIIAGIGMCELIDKMFGDSDFMKNPSVDLSIAIQVTIVLVIAGALAGLFPAIKATKVKPVEALRDE